MEESFKLTQCSQYAKLAIIFETKKVGLKAIQSKQVPIIDSVESLMELLISRIEDDGTILIRPI